MHCREVQECVKDWVGGVGVLYDRSDGGVYTCGDEEGYTLMYEKGPEFYRDHLDRVGQQHTTTQIAALRTNLYNL